MISDSKVPGSYPHKVVKIKLDNQSPLGVNLGEHRLAVLGDHGGLVAVEADHSLVEGFLGVPQLPVEVGHTALEYTPEEPRYQRPANSISLWSVLQAECQCERGLVIEELVCESIPPEVVTVLRPLQQPFVHLKYFVVRL